MFNNKENTFKTTVFNNATMLQYNFPLLRLPEGRTTRVGPIDGHLLKDAKLLLHIHTLNSQLFIISNHTHDCLCSYETDVYKYFKVEWLKNRAPLRPLCARNLPRTLSIIKSMLLSMLYWKTSIMITGPRVHSCLGKLTMMLTRLFV